jgi:methylmalonyl-CoA mutase N-terminal domain/subunit
MYRERLWTMRQYTGFGTPEETNARFKYLMAHGQDALNVAFDLPTQLGLDSDDVKAEGEVGRVGMAVDTLADMEAAFAGIPLDRVSVSLTINGMAAPITAMYYAVAEKQGAALLARRRRRDLRDRCGCARCPDEQLAILVDSQPPGVDDLVLSASRRSSSSWKRTFSAR